MAGIVERLTETFRAATGKLPKRADPIAEAGAAVAAVDALLASISKERDAAKAGLARADVERDALLLAGPDVAKLEAHEAKQREHRYAVQALDLFEAKQVDHRAGLIKARNDLVAASLRAEWQVAADAALVALRAADVARTHCIAKNQAMRLAGFEALANSVTPPPMMLAFELIDAWERDVHPPAPARPTAPPAPRLMPRVAAKPAPWTMPAPTPPRPRPPLGDRPADSEKIVVVRPGYEIAGIARVAGEVAYLPADVARQACLSGSVEIIPDVAA